MGPTDEQLLAGRAAAKRYAWGEAYDLLQQADGSGALSAEDVEGLADAALWSGRYVACIEANERAYKLHLDAGNPRRAAAVALKLEEFSSMKRERAVGEAWLNRAERLLDGDADCLEYGYFLRVRAKRAKGKRDLDTALEYARRALDIGTRHADRELMAIALHEQGRILVAKGQAEAGVALMDEAMVPAVSGELGPNATAMIYCNVISTCEELADFRRAGEWTDAANRWCERQSIAGFPGMCRVHRSEIMWLRGTWAEAEQDARRACEELREFHVGYAAHAFYNVGEIRLHMGDLDAAADAFKQAHELGREPQPGLALLRLAEGKTEAALRSIRTVLGDESGAPLYRAKLLPALVEIAIAAGDLPAARAASEELDAIAGTYGTPALEASAACCRGAVLLATGDALEARRSARRGLRLWQEVNVPYGVARARVLLAEVCSVEGDMENAVLELEAAKSAFERLGALPWARRTVELLARAGVTTARRDEAAQAIRAFVFTDIVNSTALAETIGDVAWSGLARWHEETLRRLIATHGGQEVDHAGDGFFIAFEDPAAALTCAVAIQRTLAEHRKTHGFAPEVRIGVHTATATSRGRAYKGSGVHMASRICALARGGEIVASNETLAAASRRFPASTPRAVALKGITTPANVVTIDWQ